MSIVQFLCGLFSHKPKFSHMHINGAWMYKCTRCGYENTGWWYNQRKEIKPKGQNDE